MTWIEQMISGDFPFNYFPLCPFLDLISLIYWLGLYTGSHVESHFCCPLLEKPCDFCYHKYKLYYSSNSFEGWKETIAPATYLCGATFSMASHKAAVRKIVLTVNCCFGFFMWACPQTRRTHRETLSNFHWQAHSLKLCSQRDGWRAEMNRTEDFTCCSPKVSHSGCSSPSALCRERPWMTLWP